jgi:hypothetical protein
LSSIRDLSVLRFGIPGGIENQPKADLREGDVKPSVFPVTGEGRNCFENLL